MKTRAATGTALWFNDGINRRDIEGLIGLMTRDYRVICYGNVDAEGPASCREAWASFLEKWPDYRNHLARVESRDDVATVIDHNACLSEPPLRGWTIQTVRIPREKLGE